MNVLYCKLTVDNRSAASLRAKIAEIDTLINTLMTNALTSVTQSNMAEYELDTGQTKTRIKYTSTSSVMQAIEDYERLRTMYVNKIEQLTGGRVTRMVDSKNFRR